MKLFLILIQISLLITFIHTIHATDSLCHGGTANFQLTYTTTGTIRGVTCPDLGFTVYKGIPYAASTAGMNRFQAPQPVQAWNGTRDTLEFAPSCPQMPSVLTPINGYISEDCLSLNVWTPTKPTGTTTPVLVWIHGGGFLFGSGNIEPYWGDFIANTSNIVVVTINYRLGALGFMNGPNMTGNYGFLDQQQALTWVQANIRAFGGDPQRVTIAGQSAGAMSVGLHMISPASKGLFQRAIMESNPYGLLYRTPSQSAAISNVLASDLNCSLDDLQCLRKLDIQSIISKQGTNEYQISLPFSTHMVLLWMPVIDGDVIPDQPLTMLSNGQFQTSVPVLMGTVRNETVGFVTNTILNKIVGWEYDVFVYAWFVKHGADVLKMFPAEGTDSIDSLRHLFTTYVFTCGVRYAAQKYANLGAGVYLYQWFHVPSDDVSNPTTSLCSETAACHSAEITSVFGTQSFTNQTSTASELNLSTEIMQYWAAFINGAPVSAPLQPSDDSIAWSPLNNGTYPSLIFDIPIITTTGYQAQICDIFDQWGYTY